MPHAPWHLQNNSAVLKELLSESGARQACKAVNKAGCTAPDLAMQRGFKEIIQLISDALGPASLTDRHIKSSKVIAPACMCDWPSQGLNHSKVIKSLAMMQPAGLSHHKRTAARACALHCCCQHPQLAALL